VVRVQIALVGLALVGLAFFASGRRASAIDDRISRAESTAPRVAAVTLQGVLNPGDLLPPSADGSGSGARHSDFLDARIALQSAVFTDAVVLRVRVWSPDAVLRFSSSQAGPEPVNRVNRLKAIGDRRQAIGAATVSASPAATSEVVKTSLARSTIGAGTLVRVLVTVVPLRLTGSDAPVGAVEVDQDYDRLVAGAGRSWLIAEIGFSLLAAAFLLSGPTFEVSEGAEPSVSDVLTDQRRVKEIAWQLFRANVATAVPTALAAWYFAHRNAATFAHELGNVSFGMVFLVLFIGATQTFNPQGKPRVPYGGKGWSAWDATLFPVGSMRRSLTRPELVGGISPGTVALIVAAELIAFSLLLSRG
jgi:hypothetical protein